mgnify:CR=1 FL=1
MAEQKLILKKHSDCFFSIEMVFVLGRSIGAVVAVMPV